MSPEKSSYNRGGEQKRKEDATSSYFLKAAERQRATAFK
jgi:hypothetical protein